MQPETLWRRNNSSTALSQKSVSFTGRCLSHYKSHIVLFSSQNNSKFSSFGYDCWVPCHGRKPR